MKMRLEKPAVNISNLKGGKIEKARLGDLHEKFRLDLYFLQGTMNGNQNNCSGFLFTFIIHKL